MAIIDAVKYRKGNQDDTNVFGPFQSGVITSLIISSHTSGTVKIFDGVSNIVGSGAKSTGTISFTGVPDEGDIATAGFDYYTFTSTLTNEYDVLIGANATECATNLKKAINLEAGAGTIYHSNTAINQVVTATIDGANVTLTAKLPLSVGNYYSYGANTNEGGAMSPDEENMTGGADEVHQILGTYTFPAGSQVLNFPQPISYHQGLTFEFGGTVVYTLCYSEVNNTQPV